MILSKLSKTIYMQDEAEPGRWDVGNLKFSVQDLAGPGCSPAPLSGLLMSLQLLRQLFWGSLHPLFPFCG